MVINELMYNPISGDSADEYIELYNRSGTPVDVGLWKFTSGVNFTLPTNTVIPVGGYLVVAKSQTNLLARYSNLSAANTVGDYGGTLANGGERVALSMPQAWATTDTNGLPVTNILFVTVSELSYRTAGAGATGQTAGEAAWS